MVPVAAASREGDELELSVARPARRWAIKPAPAAAAALVAAAIAFAIPVWHHPRALTDQDVLVLADFTNNTGDPVFDGILRDALAYELEQSPFLRILSDEAIRQDLQLMRRSAGERISDGLARDICLREADKAMLGGSIGSLGKSYVLELKVTECEAGATLARAQATAPDKEHVLPELGKAAQSLRAQLGESLTSIQKLAPPVDGVDIQSGKLWNVTTDSLEAFRSFRTGARLYSQGRYSEAMAALERATELDPDLAFAWFWLANAYYNSGGSKERYGQYWKQAWALRDRVSAYERLWITTNRGGQTTGQYIEGFESWARTYSRDTLPVISLGRVLASTGELDAALTKFQEAYALEPPRQAINVTDLMVAYARLDRFDEAKAVADKMFAIGEDAPTLHRELLAMAYAQADREAVARQITWFAGKPEEYLSLADQGAEARTRGQLRSSRKLLERAAGLARLRNHADAAEGFLNANPSGDALIGNCGTAQRLGSSSELKSVYVETPSQDTRDALLALCATPSLIMQAEEGNKRWVSFYRLNPAQVQQTRAAIQLGVGTPEKAIELLEAVAPYERAYPMASYLRGLALLRLKKESQAAAQFRKILDHRGANWGPLYPLSHIGLARSTVLAGDTKRACQAYEDFFRLWKDADPDVPILIQARKEYADLNCR